MNNAKFSKPTSQRQPHQGRNRSRGTSTKPRTGAERYFARRQESENYALAYKQARFEMMRSDRPWPRKFARRPRGRQAGERQIPYVG